MFAKNICILGAGTSGLITALIMRQAHPETAIKIIKSSAVDIVGVGEGSTEHWSTFMKFVHISPADLFRHAGATFKYGIKFTNWNGDNSSYIHAVVAEFQKETGLGYPHLYHKLFIDNADPLALSGEFTAASKHYQPVEYSANQFHFDTFKLNDFLQQICLVRNIEIIEDTITDVVTDNAVGIKELISEQSTYRADLFVDCSGFRKVLISKLGANWKDCSDVLPVNSAFTFATELAESDEIPSYTTATAMDAGWVFKIPTQTRYGNGYIYCDKFIDEETAIKEVEQLYGHSITVGKRFKFNAGYVTNPWIKNCVAIGLAGSFIEPLEATSIGTSIQQAFGLATYAQSWSPDDHTITSVYNSQFEEVFKNIVDFVQLHYITKRADTEFWKYCKELPLTEFNKSTINMFKSNVPLAPMFSKPFVLFRNHNWFLVLAGLGIFDRDKLVESWNSMPTETKLEAAVKLFVFTTRSDEEIPLAHRDAIDYILRTQ